MNEEKKVPFKWEYGEETISLQLGMYANNQRLYIGMITHTEDGAEPFADMTVNLPGYSLDPGEAFISGDISKDLLRFIKENKLGKVLPYRSYDTAVNWNIGTCSCSLVLAVVISAILILCMKEREATQTKKKAKKVAPKKGW